MDTVDCICCQFFLIHVLNFFKLTKHQAVSSEEVNIDKHYQLSIFVYL